MGSDLSMNPPQYQQRVITDGAFLYLQGRYAGMGDWETKKRVRNTSDVRDAFTAVGLEIVAAGPEPLAARLKLGGRQSEALRIIDAWLREQVDLSDALHNLYCQP